MARRPNPLRPRFHPLLLALAAAALRAPSSSAADPQAAPTPPPPLRREVGTPTLLARPAAVAGLYSIGEPTDEEQLYLEYVNRARADPTAEGVRFVNDSDPDVRAAYDFFNVDLGLLESQFRLLPPAPPVSFHPALVAAARRHARDMFDHDFQGHTGTDGSSVGTRASDAGYPWRFIAENVYARAKSVWHGHAGFNVDWGNGPGGIQNPPGHRENIHDADVREMGVGVVNGSNGSVGPQVVAQALGDRPGITPFVTGVVYYDFDGNQFYDLGEGIGGVTVRVSGSPAHALTARSGGYSVPVSATGPSTVTFSVPGLPDVDKAVTLTGSANVKADYSPAYSPPVVSGSQDPRVGLPNPYSFSTVGAATSYQWRLTRRSPWAGAEGAETGPGPFVADTSAGYDVVDGFTSKSGAVSFHLGHVDPPRNQYLTVSRPVRPGPASTLGFWSRHRWAMPAQSAQVQVSVDEGISWTVLWSQEGSDGAGETAFASRSVSLAAYSGRAVRLRFAYTFHGGQYYVANQPGVGLFLDDIVISDAELLSDPVVQDVIGGSTGFRFTPESEGPYLLEVRARIGDRELPWGLPSAVEAVIGSLPPEIVVGHPSPGPDGRWEIPFQVTRGSAQSFEVHGADDPSGPWTAEPGAAVEPGPLPGGYLARGASPAARRFFRILAR